MRKVLIMGATSAIAQAAARRMAAAGDALFLIARSRRRLDAVAEDLAARGAGRVETALADATDYAAHEAVVRTAIERLGGLDAVLVAHGTLPVQAECQRSFEIARRELEVNALGVISLLTPLANYFEEQGAGTIAVISSVAGDRGRRSNYVYGSAKAAVSVFTQGLRHRLGPAGVAVLTIKPGFVDTPMTRDFEKGALWASADQVAHGIVKAMDRSASGVLYTPWFWRYIMLVIRLIPERIFQRLNL
jgi:decaprenylphospho-beta-D-erythro-pentofuranosid-2-ulose 2-reductase